MKLIKMIAGMLSPKFDHEEAYYSQAVDLIDLEYRMRQVQRGDAPFQSRYKVFESKGY